MGSCAGNIGLPKALSVTVLLFLTLLTYPVGALAEGVMVSPVVVQLPPGRMAAVVTLTNHGDRDVSVQIRHFAWTQAKAAEEQLAATIGDENTILPDHITAPLRWRAEFIAR